MPGRNTYFNIIHFLYLVFFCSLFCSFRAITSISIGLILLLGIVFNYRRSIQVLLPPGIKIFLFGCSLLFLLQFITLIYTTNQHQQWASIQLKAGLIFIPLAIIFSGYINEKKRPRLLIHYCVLLLLLCMYLLFKALIHYIQTKDAGLFFYHQLVHPLNQHAVYFSIYVFIALVFLFKNHQQGVYFINAFVQLAMILFFSVFLVLLASKLVIAFYIIYLVVYFISFLLQKKQRFTIALLLFLLLVIGTVLITKNPVSERFKDVSNGRVDVVNKDTFNRADYFTGLEFRLLQWKLVKEILGERNAWLTGVSSGDAQDLLNKKYIEKNMYVGDPARNDQGFIGYNTHNEFLESSLQNGLIGLSIFCMMCFGLVLIIIKTNDRSLRFILALLLLYAFSESVFETQYALTIFIFFPVFLALKNKSKPFSDF
jgi:O-antigen ligase